VSATCSKVFNLTTSAVEWRTFLPIGIGAPCTGTLDEVSLIGRLNLVLKANSNNADISALCPATCRNAAASTQFDCINEVGPFAEDRTITLEGPVHMENSSYDVIVFDFGMGVCLPPVLTTSNSVLFIEFLDNLVVIDSVTENCLTPATPRDFTLSRSYPLLAGHTFFVRGTFVTRSMGTTCTIDLGLTSVPV
jgi:hypothetical protein